MSATTLHERILKREQTPIDFTQIMRCVKRHAKPAFRMIEDLPQQPTDKHMFGTSDCCCLLGTVFTHWRQTQIRHWVCVIKKPKKYYFFDSLGNSIAELTMRLHSGHQGLLNWSRGKNVAQNHVKLQKFESHINTCGCHVAVRLCHKAMDPRQYVEFITKSFFDPDLSVAMLTYLDLLI